MELCQCPKSGDSHFYGSKGEFSHLVPECVNALNRAILISAECVLRKNGIPYKSVNALSRAILISTFR